MERYDFNIISQWISPHSRVLDLGCGDGTLLSYLQTTRHISGYGVEINTHNCIDCISAGINVIQADINRGLDDFAESRFDYVLMTQTLQAVQKPLALLEDMTRVGKECIITFPNLGHWRVGLNLLINGCIPRSKTLPNQWYDTPNIHLFTLRDFEMLCKNKGLKILRRATLSASYQPTPLTRLFPNWMGEIAIFHITKVT